MLKIEKSKIKYSLFPLAISAYILNPSEAYAFQSVEFAIREICAHMQGNLGGLLMATAGVGGLISAAFGNMKAMYSCIVTAIGAFTISSMLSLHFDQAAQICNGGGGAGGGGTARTKLGQLDNDRALNKEAEVSRFNVEQAVKTYIDKSSAAIGTDPSTDKSLDFYADSYSDDSEMELF
jgi:hypothetical protein